MERIVQDDDEVSVCTSCTGNSTMATKQSQPYRYKYSCEMVEILFKFARDHMESDKHEFMEAWKDYIKEEKIDNLIKRETEMLASIGYVGSVSTKMYKSVRYYFMKKARMEESTKRIRMIQQERKDKENENDLRDNGEENEKKRKLMLVDTPTEIKKRAYYKINKDILSLMDNFIRSEIKATENTEDKEEEDSIEEYEDIDEEEDKESVTEEKNTDKRLSNKNRLKPSVMYESFRDKYDKLISQERYRMTQEMYPYELLITKIKKTFKNRCYTILSQSD